MSTEELLAVLDEGPATAVPAQAQAQAPEGGAVIEFPVVATPPARAARIVRLTPPPPQAPKPGLLRRLRCGRRGHDPRPHRPQPHDAVVYRCLRCGMQMAAPKPPERPAP